MATLEARLVITASDETGSVFRRLEDRIAKISRMTAEVGRMSGMVDRVSGSHGLASEFAKAQHAAAKFAAEVETAAGAFGRIATRAGQIAPHVRRATEETSRLAQALKKVGLTEHHGMLNYAAASAAAAIGAHSVVHGAGEVLHAGAHYQHERVAAANAGRTPEEIRAFEEEIRRTSTAVPTASYTESMKTLIETTSAFGSPEHAIEHLKFMMRTASVLKSASGGKISESAGEMGQQFAKFFEMRGVANNPKLFENEGNEMVRAMAFSGGTFNPREMFNFAQQAKSALRNYDLEFLSRYMPSIVGEQGGDRAGTGANAFFNTIMGKARDKKQAEFWMKMGLLDPSKVEMKAGHVVSWSPGAVKDTDLALRNPVKWQETTALKALEAHGVNIRDAMELSKANAILFRNQNANQFANETSQLADRTRLHKDADLIGKTDHPEAMYKRNLGEDPTQAIEALKASLNSLSTAVSAPAMKTAAGAITGIAAALTQLSNAAMNHPIAAMTAGGAVGAAALGGAGYMSYQLMNGFGLGKSAVALDGSAAALTRAAVALGAKGGGMPGGASPETKKPGGGLPFGFTGPLIYAAAIKYASEQIPQINPMTYIDPLLPKLDAAIDKKFPGLRGAGGRALADATHELFNPPSGRRISIDKYIPKSSGYSRDYTLGFDGGFAPVGKNVPPGGFAFMPDYERQHLGGGGPVSQSPAFDPGALAGALSGKIDAHATVEGTAKVEVVVKVEPGSDLIRASADAKAATMALKSASGSAAATGNSMPEANPTGKSGGGR